MNVALHGILPLLTLTAVLAAVVAPVGLASWMRRATEVAVVLGQRPMVSSPLLGVLPVLAGRRLPMDVVPANQAWRAPPTVRPHLQPNDPADSLGRRLG